MRSTNFNGENDIKIYSLSPPCQWGDHYLATSDYYYIIKGNQYRRVTNMSEDKDAVVYSLHPNCRGGSQYYSAFGTYYIVFADRGVYRRVKNMNNDKGGVEYSIHQAFHDGLYFWGTTDYVYCLKQAGKWGVLYHRSTNMNLNKKPATFSVHESVLKFIPGGIAQTDGKAFGGWHNIKSFANETDLAVDWERTITKVVGFKRSEMPSREQNWSIELGAQYESGQLGEAIFKFQFSLKAQYGGKGLNTEQQQWRNIHEESETLNLHIPPHSEVYIWQYQMGFGQTKNLFSPNLRITEDSNPPDEPPAMYYSHAK